MWIALPDWPIFQGLSRPVRPRAQAEPPRPCPTGVLFSDPALTPSDCHPSPNLTARSQDCGGGAIDCHLNHILTVAQVILFSFARLSSGSRPLETPAGDSGRASASQMTALEPKHASDARAAREPPPRPPLRATKLGVRRRLLSRHAASPGGGFHHRLRPPPPCHHAGSGPEKAWHPSDSASPEAPRGAWNV